MIGFLNRNLQLRLKELIYLPVEEEESLHNFLLHFERDFIDDIDSYK